MGTSDRIKDGEGFTRPGERMDDKAGSDIDPAGRMGFVRPGERIDDLQRAGLRIIQDPARFCFGMDAVLLSAYVQMKRAGRGLDLGTGNGIIPILLSARTDCARLTGLEIQPASADLAARSVALNGLQERISIVQGDIKEADRIFAAASFDFITCNPPYRPAGAGRITGAGRTTDVGRITGADRPAGAGRIAGAGIITDVGRITGAGEITGPAQLARETGSGSKAPEAVPVRTIASEIARETGSGGSVSKAPEAVPASFDPRAIARHELLCTFDDVARCAARLLRPGGHFYLVHRPLRLAEIISKLCACGLEPKRMRLVHPHAGQAPNLVLLDCVRGGAPELRVEPPLIVYGADGAYTPELLEMYGALTSSPA